MGFRDELENAIAVHRAWKVRLREAIENDPGVFKPSAGRADNQCDFGRWLYSLPAAVAESPIWREVQIVHAQFHLEAARVLSLALQGAKAEALEAIDSSGHFRYLSDRLAILIVRWSDEAG